MNVKRILLKVLLLGLVLATSTCLVQEGYQINGEIKGLNEGTTIYLKSFDGKISKSIKTTAGGKFRFTGKVEEEGLPYNLTIAELDGQREIFVDNNLILIIRGTAQTWPTFTFSLPKVKGNYLDFFSKVQEPFNTAFNSYSLAMKILKDQPNSMKMTIAQERYKVATQTYYKDVFLWVGMYPDSYYSPFLIRLWWPKEDRRNAYGRLTKRVQRSYYGKLLYNETMESLKIKK